MSTIFKKMNLGERKEILVLDAPESFESELALLTDVRLHRRIGELKEIEFSLAFVTRKSDLDRISPQIAKRAKGDALLWFAYPKKSSKRYICDFDRDHGWDRLGDEGFECVRMVAIDEDWSAARFRRVDFIKTLKRDEKFLRSDVAKERRAARK